MAQAAQVLEKTRDLQKKEIRPLLHLIQPPKPVIYLDENDIDPPNDWLDDPLVALERPRGPYTFDNADEYLDTETVELYNGWLVRQEMGDFTTIEVAGNFFENLSSAVRSQDFGRVLMDQMECLLKNDNTIKPDLSMISWERRNQLVMPKGPNDRPTLQGSPEFVVEIRSPSNRRRQETLKRQMYFDNGTEIIWDVDEQREIIYVYRASSQNEPETYTREDEIHCEPLLPGWRRRVANLFDDVPVEIMYSEIIDTYHDKGREEGEEIGEQRGKEIGHAEGRKEGEEIGEQRGKEIGHVEGRKEGEEIGEQRGKEIGHVEGRKEGELSSKQDMLIRLLQAKFPDLPEQALDTIKQTSDIDQLDGWFNQSLAVQSLDELSL